MTHSRLRTSVMLVGGPVIALVTHGLIYLTSYRPCLVSSRITPHLVSGIGVLLLVSLIIVTAQALRRHATNDAESMTVRNRIDRRKFAALAGISVTLLSLLLTISQWSSVVVFGPCDQR